MSRFIEGQDRSQVTLLPECLDNFIADDNPVRVVDAFIGELDIRIVNPDAERTATLVAALGAAFPACDVAAATERRAGFDMVVNASTVGMKPGDGLPGDIGVLTPDMLVGDVVVCAEPTAIIGQAQAAGCRWFNGHDMHSGQIAALMHFLAPAQGRDGRRAPGF